MKHPVFEIALTCLALLMGLMLVGCDGVSSSYTTIEDDAELRIVTLAPAMTQILVDMEMGESIVGVAENDAAAPPGAGLVGNVANINQEKLVSLNPTHVLGMRMGGAQLDALEATARREGFSLALYPYPRSVDAVGLIIWNEREFIGGELPPDAVPSLGTVLDARGDASDVKYTMLHRLSELDRVTQDLKDTKPSVLLVNQSDPTVTASGPGSVLDELLAHAGGVNAAASATTAAPIYTREDILELSPEVILLLMPNAYPLKSLQEDQRLAIFRDLDIPAVRNGRIYLLNDPVIQLAESTAMAKIAGEIAKRLYPDQAKRIDAAVTSEYEVNLDAETLERSLDEFKTAPALPDDPSSEESPAPPAEGRLTPADLPSSLSSPELETDITVPSPQPDATPAAPAADPSQSPQ